MAAKFFPPYLDAKRVAVLLLDGVCGTTAKVVGPSGPPRAPAPVMIGSAVEHLGPDYVFSFLFGVHFIRSRDVFVIFSFFGVPFVRCTAHRFDKMECPVLLASSPVQKKK